jgi:hypothetical protein
VLTLTWNTHIRTLFPCFPVWVRVATAPHTVRSSSVCLFSCVGVGRFHGPRCKCAPCCWKQFVNFFSCVGVGCYRCLWYKATPFCWKQCCLLAFPCGCGSLPRPVLLGHPILLEAVLFACFPVWVRVATATRNLRAPHSAGSSAVCLLSCVGMGPYRDPWYKNTPFC